MLEQLGLESRLQAIPGMRAVAPVGFLDFLRLESAAALVLTDSGGVQEEACILGVPCVTLRDSTERPETIEVGANLLAGSDPAAIDDAAATMLSRGPGKWPNPFGDGHAAERVVADLVRRLGS
jgi:UDP-N-acetylglucosamine 2-epimerase (non-hydrolysing)